MLLPGTLLNYSILFKRTKEGSFSCLSGHCSIYINGFKIDKGLKLRVHLCDIPLNINVIRILWQAEHLQIQILQNSESVGGREATDKLQIRKKRQQNFNNHVFIYCNMYYVIAFKHRLCSSFAASYRCSSFWTLCWLTSLHPPPSSLSKVQERRVQLKYFLWRWKKRWCHSKRLCHYCSVVNRKMRRGGGGAALDVMRPPSQVLQRGSRGVGRCGSRTWRGVG